MILMYHKVDVIAPTKWWVLKQTFVLQLKALSGYEFVFLDDYDATNPKHCVITFDDAYENVYRHAFPALLEMKLPFEVFINGGHLGGWNYFDPSEPLTRFCSFDQLEIMATNGGRIQWHSNLHSDLTSTSHVQLLEELTIPAFLQKKLPHPNFNWFAYPYGLHNELVTTSVAKRFRGALSVDDGNNGLYQMSRVTVTEESMFN